MLLQLIYFLLKHMFQSTSKAGFSNLWSISMSQKHLQEEQKGVSVVCFTASAGHAGVRGSSALAGVGQVAEGALAEGCAEFSKAAC